MDILIRVIDNGQHRHPFTGADWFWDNDGNLQVRVSKLSDWRYEALLGIHEAVEAIMCKHNNVTQESVDVFDTWYDQTHASDLNAGDDPNAPYRREHCFATAIERVLCAELNVNWKQYDDELAAIPSVQPKVLINK